MPFIRYKNGDLARFAAYECPCGCKLPLLAEITGRTGDDIYLPDGKMIAWKQLRSFMNHPDIRQFQIVQNKDASLTVKFIPEDKSDIEYAKNVLASRFKVPLGNSVKIDFCIVKNIDLNPSGKSRLVISHYDHPGQIPSSS